MIKYLVAVVCALCVMPAHAFDPVTSVVSKGISTAMDLRTKDEVKADVEIDSALTKSLMERKGDAFKNVSVLVFARHVVLVGFVRNDEEKRKAEELARSEKRLRSLKNDIQIGAQGGSAAGNLVLDEKIDLKLKSAKGVSSVNMRWKVYGGDVFLMGVAKTDAEAKRAALAVKEVSGVKTLHDSLRVGKK